MDGLILFIVVVVVVAALLGFFAFGSGKAVRWARKGSPAATVIGWALLFLSAGMNPQPPPQEQVEEANRQKRLKKDAQSGDPEH